MPNEIERRLCLGIVRVDHARFSHARAAQLQDFAKAILGQVAQNSDLAHLPSASRAFQVNGRACSCPQLHCTPEHCSYRTQPEVANRRLYPQFLR